LPTQSTPFIGREAELDGIAQLLGDPACRLLTLVGPGGSGKTRLALEAASRLEANACKHGIFFVSLAPLSSVDAIVPTVADVLGFQFFGGGTPQQQLLDFLRQRNLLLIMDNYEHLLAGADFVAHIIKTAPDVKILATSRARLNVGGEHRFQVAGMAYPESTLETVLDATRYSAVELFTQSARRARPDFQLAGDNLSGVLDVCRLAEGMPLAVRLAAAWVAVLPPDEIAAEIGRNIDVLATERRDVPERQRSMRATFDHSWTMLAEREREVMRALSVFRGAFTRKAAQQVSGASLADLMALVNKSLVHRTSGGHFELHELLRQYAAQKLGETPAARETARDRHAAYYATALHRWGTDLKSHRQLTAMAEMDMEIKNARAAWNWAVERGHVERLDQAMDGLFLFYEWRARYLEGETACRMAENALAARQTADALRVRAKILAWQGVFNRHMGRPEMARQLAQQSLSLLDAPKLTERNYRAEKIVVLRDLGWVTGYTDPKEGDRLLRQSLALCRALDDRWMTAHVLFLFGGTLAFSISGDYREAQEMLEESLAIFQALGDQRGTAYALAGLHEIAVDQWHLDEAKRLARESVALLREIDDRHLLVYGLLKLGWILYWRGENAEAHAVLEENLTTTTDLGISHLIPAAYSLAAVVKLQLGDYTGARGFAEQGLAIARDSVLPGHTAIPQEALGRVALVEEAYEEASVAPRENPTLFFWTGWREQPGEALAVLGVASLRQGQIAEAHGHMSEAVRIAGETKSVPATLFALSAVALLLVDADKPAAHQAKRALELYALASRYPYVANSRWFQDVVGKHITAAAAALPPEVVGAAQERGRALDLWGTAKELIEELERWNR
jgi:predicted ATPase